MNTIMTHLYLFLASLLALVALQGINGVQYEVINQTPTTPGGVRFSREIGIDYTKDIMRTINNFIWNIFEENASEDRKNVEVVTVFIEENKRRYKGAEAITYGGNISISSVYLQAYQGNVKWEFTSLLYREMTHVFQWNGAGQAPFGLIQGIADYIILKANYYPPDFAKLGEGDRWDQGYDVTARFWEYCEGLRTGFVAGLNNKLRYAYSDRYFVQLLDKSVDELWSEYKAKHRNLQA